LRCGGLTARFGASVPERLMALCRAGGRADGRAEERRGGDGEREGETRRVAAVLAHLSCAKVGGGLGKAQGECCTTADWTRTPPVLSSPVRASQDPHGMTCMRHARTHLADCYRRRPRRRPAAPTCCSRAPATAPGGERTEMASAELCTRDGARGQESGQCAPALTSAQSPRRPSRARIAARRGRPRSHCPSTCTATACCCARFHNSMHVGDPPARTQGARGTQAQPWVTALHLRRGWGVGEGGMQQASPKRRALKLGHIWWDSKAGSAAWKASRGLDLRLQTAVSDAAMVRAGGRSVLFCLLYDTIPCCDAEGGMDL
jgi:hypothetical protein